MGYHIGKAALNELNQKPLKEIGLKLQSLPASFLVLLSMWKSIQAKLHCMDCEPC